jgi:two-component system phosphate regulon response regulator PhoB
MASRKVLIVEDNDDSRNLLQFYIATLGHEVMTAPDGAVGIALTFTRRPNVIITDLNLPNVDGIELMKRIKDNPDFADIPIVVYTAYGSELLHAALEVGAKKVFNKPVDFDSMRDYVAELLK